MKSLNFTIGKVQYAKTTNVRMRKIVKSATKKLYNITEQSGWVLMMILYVSYY